MAGLSKSVYVPPHLRNKGTANGTKVDSAQSGNATSGSPAASDKSKTTLQTKLHRSPNGANHVQGSPPSPPTTPREPEHVKPEKPEKPQNSFNNSWSDSNAASPPNGVNNGWGDSKAASFQNGVDDGWSDSKTASPQNGVYSGWDDPKPDTPALVKRNGNPRWSRGPQPYKKTVWPKQKDMKYIPSSSDSDGGISSKSNSDEDPEYDIMKLLDWKGDWLPAPELWSARKGHTDRRFGQWIESWMNAQPADCSTPVFRAPGTFNGHEVVKIVGDEEIIEYVFDEGVVGKDMAPRYWVNAKVDHDTLREYWKSFLTAEPGPLEGCDLLEHSPWWELYEDMVYEDEDDEKHSKSLSCYLNGLVVPEARVKPDDPEFPTRPIDLASAEEKVQAQKRRTEEIYRRMMAKQNRPVPEPKFPMSQIQDRRLKPQANIYIRPVQPADVKGIADLYNWYVANTIYTNEFDARTEEQIGTRINIVIQSGLPYLVAISKSNQSRATPGYVTEEIVGFVSLDDCADQSSLWRYTFDMEIFVHPGFTRKGIGKCLMDRLLEMADTSYRARGGYQYVNNFEYLKAGPSRVVKTILLNVHHVNGEDPQEGWQGKFMKDYTFLRVGRLPQVGHKLDQVVDVSIYAHHTKEQINAGLLPTVVG